MRTRGLLTYAKDLQQLQKREYKLQHPDPCQIRYREQTCSITEGSIPLLYHVGCWQAQVRFYVTVQSAPV